MSHNAFVELIQEWEARHLLQRQKVPMQISVFDTDRVKVQALAAVYGITEQEILASVLHHGLFELETRMPYQKGSRVIRVEEGEEIFEDIGMMPRYIAKLQELTRGH